MDHFRDLQFTDPGNEIPDPEEVNPEIMKILDPGRKTSNLEEVNPGIMKNPNSGKKFPR